MSDYTPTTQNMRDRVRHSYHVDSPGVDGEAKFNDWIEAHDRAVKAEAWDEGWKAMDDWDCQCWSECTCQPINPYQEET